MNAPTKTRTATEPGEGYVDPERWYTEDGMMKHIRIGRSQLIDARKAGFLPSKWRGNQLFYSGREIIRYIEAGEDR